MKVDSYLWIHIRRPVSRQGNRDRKYPAENRTRNLFILSLPVGLLYSLRVEMVLAYLENMARQTLFSVR